MPKFGIGLPRAILYAYAALTLVEVVLRRDDFPLSGFPMFSRMKAGARGSERYLALVSEDGERRLEHKELRNMLGGSFAMRVLRPAGQRNREVRNKILTEIAERIRKDPPKGPLPFAVRYYSERAASSDKKAGSSAAVTRLLGAEYVPPPSLLARLQAEERSEATPLPPERGMPGDHVVELDASHCNRRCTVVEDPLASSGSAIRLKPSERGKASAVFTMPAGSWFVLLRMRTSGKPSEDILSFEVQSSGKGDTNEIGKHKRALPAVGWVWASSEPGYPALKLRQSGERQVTLVARHAPVEVDQIWFSRRRSELPTWNAPVVVSTEEGSR